eukprot:gnl/MRDRNA2_/MRDRNA2_39370_c0_seq2.p1 gnl/MRDRNA2_/MRDRNA2_39370_c0~~gnl/MRDRNA2_/MRDRNA2_39370_c0_seq2.p1  ORF type:complete len:229 (-),score=34.73 gnl/MRDRNA2_/MRDRNA2_39370_c0_seq2:50-736(-)
MRYLMSLSNVATCCGCTIEMGLRRPRQKQQTQDGSLCFDHNFDFGHTWSEKEDARKMEEAMLQSVREYRNQTKNQTTPDVMLQLEEYLRTLSIHETPPPQQMPTVSIPPMIDPRSLHPQPPQIRHISQVTQVQQTTEPPPIQEPTPAPLRIKQSSQPAQAGRQQRRQSHKVSQDALGRSTQFLLLDLRSNHIEYVVPGLLATIGFMLAVVGLRNFRCLQSVAGDMVSP